MKNGHTMYTTPYAPLPSSRSVEKSHVMNFKNSSGKNIGSAVGSCSLFSSLSRSVALLSIPDYSRTFIRKTNNVLISDIDQVTFNY